MRNRSLFPQSPISDLQNNMGSFKTQLFALVSGLILVFLVIIFLIFRGIDKTRYELLQINKLYLAQITLKLDLTLWEDSFSSILEKNLFSNYEKSKKIGFLNVYFIKLLEGESSGFPGVDFGYYDNQLNSILGCPPPLGPPLPEKESPKNNSATWTTLETRLKSEAIAELSRRAVQEKQDIFLSKQLGNKFFLFYIHPLARNGRFIGTGWALMEFRDFYESFRTNVEISLIFVVIAILVALAVGNNLRRGVAYIRSGLQRLKFDLTYRFEPRRGELGEITATINEMSSTLGKVRNYTELVLENTIEGVIALDREAKVVYFNKSAGFILNIPQEKIIGSDYRKFFSQEGDIVRKSIDDTIGGNEINILKTIYRMPGGKEIPISINTLRLGTEERKGVVILLRDLSDTERIERRLRQSDKLAALGKLVAGVAHEIRNPIAAIRANVQLWEKRIDKAVPSRENLKMVINEVDRLNDIVNKWLIFARERASSREICQINDIIERTIDLMKIEIQNKKIAFSCELEKKLPPVCINPQEIEQVTINIIMNSLDMLNEKDSLILKSSYDNEKMEIKVEFTDTGPGIPLEIQGKIFDPFFTTKEEGTGLGLAICYDIITAYGGTIDLETIIGKGTTFYFTLPAGKI